MNEKCYQEIRQHNLKIDNLTKMFIFPPKCNFRVIYFSHRFYLHLFLVFEKIIKYFKS